MAAPIRRWPDDAGPIESVMEVWDRNETDAEPDFTLRRTLDLSQTGPVQIQHEPGDAGGTVTTRIRHRRTQFTVDDFSDFVGEQPVVLSI